MRIAALLLFAFGAFAQQPAAAIRDTCGAFEVRMQSIVNDAMQDDMRVVIAFGENELAVPLSPALYVKRATLLNVTNLCSELTALDAGGDRVLLLLSRNNRPTWDKLDAVLIDTKAHRVLDVRRDLGEIKSQHAFVVRPAEGGAFDVLLIRELLADSGCDCADAAIEEWMRLTIRDGKLSARWARK